MELTGDDVDTVHNSTRNRVGALTGALVQLVVEMLRNTSTTRSVEANSVDLVEERERTVAFGKVAYLRDGTNATAHRVDALEGDDFRRLLGVLRQLHLEVLQVVVLENDALGTRVPHALDHGRVVHGVREVDAPGELFAQGGERSVVGDVARREDERGRLAVQRCDLGLESEMHPRIASDVPGTTGTVTVGVQRAAADRQKRCCGQLN